MRVRARSSEMLGFEIVWMGQIISILAPSVTTFGMTCGCTNKLKIPPRWV
jgi:hypothetical protein